jgi:hypothetical protein
VKRRPTVRLLATRGVLRVQVRRLCAALVAARAAAPTLAPHLAGRAGHPGGSGAITMTMSRLGTAGCIHTHRGSQLGSEHCERTITASLLILIRAGARTGLDGPTPAA